MATHKPGDRSKCPHCQTTVKFENPSHNEWTGASAVIASGPYRVISTHSQCPQCLKFIITVEEFHTDPSTGIEQQQAQRVIWPLTSGRDPVPPDIPSHIAQDYAEAAHVLAISSKASAALSRRCLQIVLSEAGKTRARDLADQIQEVLPSLPTRIAENLDAVRAIGNFAAHPIKSKATGTIVEVEAGEAEWNLDVLDALFDHYYIRPEVERKKREALNLKLKDAGKPSV